MTDDIHIDGHNEEAEFERQDLGAKPVILFLVGLTVGCLLVALALRGMYSYLDARENRHQPALNPLVQQTHTDTRSVARGDIAKFPQPRLETNEPSEINEFRLHEEQMLHSYGWVDQSAGVVRIPIDRAMIIGVGIFSYLLYYAWKGKYTPEYHTPLENSGLYWHFVDIVWIYLFPLLYLIDRKK